MESYEKIAKAAKDHGKKVDDHNFGKLLMSRLAHLEELVLAIAAFVEFPMPADDEPLEPSEPVT